MLEFAERSATRLVLALRTASQLPRDSEQFAIHIDGGTSWTRMRDDP
jgi:hypothetical protein